MTTKKLTKSNTNKALTGTLAGIAEYFGWSPRVLRIVYVIGSILTAHYLLGLLIYILLMVLIPSASQRPDDGMNSWMNLFRVMNQYQARGNDKHSGPRERKVLHDVEEKDHHQ